jgi:hypothetical protein
MPCGLKATDNSCAHEVSKYLGLMFGDGAHMRIVQGLLVCGCGLPLS